MAAQLKNKRNPSPWPETQHLPLSPTFSLNFKLFNLVEKGLKFTTVLKILQFSKENL
jgi:hypothetical protein